MRHCNVYFLPDMWNDWHWFIYDQWGSLVASSERGHFHLIDAQKEADSVMHYRIAS